MVFLLCKNISVVKEQRCYGWALQTPSAGWGGVLASLPGARRGLRSDTHFLCARPGAQWHVSQWIVTTVKWVLYPLYIRGNWGTVGFITLKKKIFFTFTKRGREGEREGEKHPCKRETPIGHPPHAPHWELNPKPRHMPWPGAELATCCSAGWRRANWATLVRVGFTACLRSHE